MQYLQFSKLKSKLSISTMREIHRELSISWGLMSNSKKTLISNTENYMEFIMHMASLLSSKVSEKQVMKKLLYTKGQLDVIVNNLPYGIIAVDEDENITCFNQQAGKLLEMNPSEVIGKPAKEILPQSSFTEVIKSGKKILDMTKEYQIGNIEKLCSVLHIPSFHLGKSSEPSNLSRLRRSPNAGTTVD